jgi:hypothetical protein
MIEQVVDENGTLLWEETYIFRRVAKPGERILRDGIEYVILSSSLLSADLIQTVVQRA